MSSFTVLKMNPWSVPEELVPALEVRLQQDVVVGQAGLQILQQTPGLKRLARTLQDEGRGSVRLCPFLTGQWRLRLKEKTNKIYCAHLCTGYMKSPHKRVCVCTVWW